jgi:hypothetical protein
MSEVTAPTTYQLSEAEITALSAHAHSPEIIKIPNVNDLIKGLENSSVEFQDGSALSESVRRLTVLALREELDYASSLLNNGRVIEAARRLELPAGVTALMSIVGKLSDMKENARNKSMSNDTLNPPVIRSLDDWKNLDDF